MAFNPYGSFLDFSQKDWSVEDEDLKSTGRKGDSADAHKKRQSSPELIIPVQIPLNEEQDADLKRTKSIRSDPETSVTAALTEHHESFSFEINLPPALDVSPLSCKESVIASMMSRSVDRALESPPLMIRTSVPHEKRSRARSKSRSRETSQNPTVRRGRKEPGEAFLGLSEKNGRSHSKETTLLPSWDKQAEGRSRSRSRAPVDLPISDGVSRSHSKERKRASSRERYSAKTTRSRSIDPTLGSENYGGSPSKEKQYEPSPLKDRRKGHSSRSRSIDHSSKFFAEDHGPSKSKDWKLSSPDANHSERSSRSRSTDPTHRSRDSDVRRRIRTRSTSVARSKEEDFSKRSQSKVRVHIMEEIREKNGHASPSPSRRSPSRSRHHAQSTAEPQSSTSSSRARSKSRPRHKDKSSPRGDTGLPLASLDENDLAVIKELTVFSSLKEGVPPPPPSMDTHFSSPRSKPKNAEARRSKHNRTSGNHDSAHESK